MASLVSKIVNWSDRIREKRLLSHLKPHLSGRTLDVGCWNGDMTKHLGPGSVGIDVELGPNPAVPVTLFDGKHIPFEDRQFDTVLCCGVLHHAEDPDALVDEMKRVGKRILVYEDDVDDPLHRFSMILLHRIGGPMTGIPYRVEGFRRTQQWRDMFAKHGLKTICFQRHPSVIPLWPFLRHYLFVLEAE